MNRVAFLFAVGFCFAVGQALKCYKCGLGIGNLCITKETTCASGEFCFNGVGKAVGFIDIKSKGCLKKDDCNRTTEVDFISHGNTTFYQMTKTCCNFDLCNAAPGMPWISGLSLALATVSAALATNLLI